MEESNKNIILDIDEESQESVGHMIIHEDPASPDTSRATTPEPTDDISDSNDSDYDADTICDSPRSTDTTFELQDDNETGEASAVASLQCHETVDWSDMPPLEEAKKNKEDSSDESEVGEGSSESNEPHGINPNESNIIQNYDESGLLFSPGYKPLEKPKEESEDEH